MPFGRLLRHGISAGLAGGAVSAVMLWWLVEPIIGRALVIEESRPGGHSHGGDGEPLVSRSVQVVAGGITTVLVGVMVGVVFAVVYATVRHRIPGVHQHVAAYLLAALGFGIFTLLPALHVPANPPAVGDPSTVSERTLLYALTILLGLLLAGLVAAGDRGCRSRGMEPATRAGVDVLVAAIGLALILVAVPQPSGVVPSDVPADLLWDFRIASLAQLAALWLTLGLTFGLLVGSRRRASVGASA
jgi:predicted cobalt transporter CbtA